MKTYTLLTCMFALSAMCYSQVKVPQQPRILISTDIGGTDPDDNQSMMHYLLYSNEFDCEGLVSSPSYGDGTKEEIIRMIGLYEKDLSKLKKHGKGWSKPDYADFRNMLARYFAAKAQKAIDAMWDNGQISEQTIEEWGKTKMRTPYRYALHRS